ncbi:hypothetical protein WJX74_001938 [Apatococcus lobatus]|uniref:CRAL-TRIO domain-containing protein n=1 Tax=Apatococcus lobatus TaxID=904363 RepID=A0AAW1QDI1_9CHLO
MSKPGGLLRTLSPKRSLEEPLDPQSATPDLNKASSNKRWNFKRQKSIVELPDPTDETAFKADWGITLKQEEALLAQFTEELKAEKLIQPEKGWPDRYTLRRFLRARQHKLPAAKLMWANHVKWRKEIGADTIMDDFTFDERDAFVSIYPQGYHKTDKLGRPIYVQHLGMIDMKKMLEVTDEERIIKFHVQEYERCARYIMPACSRAAGIGMKHLSAEVRKMMGSISAIDQNNYPEMLGRTCIINAPAVFKFVFAAVKPMFDPRTLAKMEICGRNYTQDLLRWVDAENLPEYLGGTSKSTLLDDTGPWNNDAVNQAASLERALSHTARVSQRQPSYSRTSSSVSPERKRVSLAGQGTSPLGGAPAGGSPQGLGQAPLLPPGQVRLVPPARAAQPMPELATPFSSPPAGGLPAGVPQDGLELSAHHPSASAPDDSDDDDGYYSPRSFSSARSSFSMAGSSDLERFSQLDHEAEAGIPSKMDGQALPAARMTSPVEGPMQIPIQARVKVLEDKLPSLSAKLPAHYQKAIDADGFKNSSPTEQNLQERLAHLENAMAILLKAQEEEGRTKSGKPGRQSQPTDKAKQKCCGCSIM